MGTSYFHQNVMRNVIRFFLSHPETSVNTDGLRGVPPLPKLRVVGSSPIYRSSQILPYFPRNSSESASNWTSRRY